MPLIETFRGKGGILDREDGRGGRGEGEGRGGGGGERGGERGEGRGSAYGGNIPVEELYVYDRHPGEGLVRVDMACMVDMHDRR